MSELDGNTQEYAQKVKQLLSEVQLKFIELDKRKAEYKQFLEEYKESINALVAEMGVGGSFQDDEGIVYLIEDCDGKFVYFDKFEIKRTKREGETKGSLSVVKAKELGYNV